MMETLMEAGSRGGLPVIAFAMGDPAGISPELTAKLLADSEIRPKAKFVVFGDKRILDAGAAVAKVDPDVKVVSS